MKLLAPALDRIANANITSEKLAKVFENLGKAAVDLEAVDSAIVLNYQGPDDLVEPGDLLPVITLSLRPDNVFDSK